MKRVSIFKSVFVLLAISMVSISARAEIAIITNPDAGEIGMSKDIIADIFMGKVKSFKNGVSANPVDQAVDADIREAFYKKVVGKTNRAVSRHWAKVKFTGKGKPPVSMNGDIAVRNYVASNSGAIGYVSGKFIDKTVKVVLILP